MVVIRIARGTAGASPNAILDNQNNDFNAFFQDLDGIAVPANPAAGHRRLFVDSVDDVLKVRTAAGATVSLEAGAGGGEANTSSNSGAGDGWALAKVGVDLPFKSLITTAPISTTVNAADLTLVLAALVNADIAAGAAIAYSKLNLTGLVVNADINAAAAIAYAKLNLTGLVVNADINAAAAIATTKLADSANFVLSDQNNDLNAFFQDLDGIAVPANPAAGHRRLFVDSADDVLKVRTAGGVTTSLEGGGGSGNTFTRIVKTSDETVSNSTTPQDDDELLFTPAINKTYGWLFHWNVIGTTVADIRGAFTIPSGAVMTRENGTWSSLTMSNNADATNIVIYSLGSEVNRGVLQMGSLVMSSTAGDVNWTWAQGTAEVSDTKTLQGSTLVVWEEL